MSVPVDTVERMCAMTLTAVTAYRNSVPGPVDLVWRVEPKLQTDPETGARDLYCRLCFEPLADSRQTVKEHLPCLE